MDPQVLVDRQRKEFEGLLANQKNEQQGLFGQYQQRISAQPNLTSVFRQAQEERGLPQLQGAINLFQGQIGDVKGLLDRLGENTQARTSGTNANQAYLDRLRASEGGQLNTQLGRLGAGLEPVVQAYGLASQDIGKYLELTQAQQQKELSPLELQINSLNDRFTREITGFSKNKEDELSVLLDKIQRERTLADREWQRAQQLAAEEREFQRQRNTNAQQASYLNSQSGLGNFSQGTVQSRQGGGFNFQDAGGRPISAARFAQLNNVGIGDLLYRMGQSGDRYAAQAYRQISNVVPAKSPQDALNAAKKQYSALFWGA